jgi:hypothetical protein
VKASEPDNWLVGGETITAGRVSFVVTCVPGHSPGHLSYYCGGHLFSGDVLFAGSVGRTDLPSGDWSVLQASIATTARRVPAGDRRPPGPRPETTLGAELQATRSSVTCARRGCRHERQDRAARAGTHDVVPAEMPVWQRVTG